MRFTSNQDYFTVKAFNREVINTIVDTPVILYKLNIQESKKNVYGESTSKQWYTAVQVPCLINRRPAIAVEDAGQINYRQPIIFGFLRVQLEEQNIYPEAGDIVEFDSQYYELTTANEVQLWGGQTSYNHTIDMEGHLTAKKPLHIEK